MEMEKTCHWVYISVFLFEIWFDFDCCCSCYQENEE